MAGWGDSFNRADGPLGANWSTTGAPAPSIVSEDAYFPPNTGATAIPLTAAGEFDITVEYRKDAQGHFANAYTQVNWNADGHGIAYASTADDWNLTIAILWCDAGFPWGAETSGFIQKPAGDTIVINFKRIGTTYSAWYGATKVCEWAAGGFPHGLGDLVKVSNGNTPITIAAFNTPNVPAQTMQITPDPLWVGGGACLVTATGVNTEWEGSTPPSTTFSADHGTVLSQNITSHTTALLVYEPAEYLGPIVFSETQYGCTDTVNGVLTPPEEGGNGLCQLTPAGAAIVNSAGGLYEGAQVLTNMQVIFPEAPGVPGSLDFIAWASDIWHAHFGQWEGSSPSGSPVMLYLWSLLNAGQIPNTGAEAIKDGKSLKYDTELLKARWWNSLEEAYYNVDDILDAISAIPPADLSQVRTDLGIEGQLLYVSVLEAIRATRGDDVSSVLGVLSELGIIRSGHAYTLESVMDAIAAIPGSDLAPVLHKLDHIQPDEADTLTTVQHQADAIKSETSSIWSSLSAMRTVDGHTLQDILDRLDDLEAKIDAIDATGAPVWPGIANVTMGAPVALVDQLVLDGPMDGIVVNVTSPPVGLGQYRVGTRRLDYGQMRLAFESDGGELEGWQYFGFEQALYTPHSMAQASKCRFQLLGGLGGTVTPWTRS